jgi:serine/threonine-protein kinase PknG
MADIPCSAPGCTGTIEDGYCDTCGRPAEGAGPATAITSSSRQVARTGGYVRTGRITGARRPQPSTGTAGTAAGTAATGASGRGTRGTRGSSTRRRALGGGLVQMPVMPSADPLSLALADPRVPPDKCFCPNCKNKVNPDKRFCSNCGAEYSFRPALRAGDVVAGQYEVRGPIAFGGLGWIYLAMDTGLNRWVVLKGLLNSKDEAAAAAAIAERQFLAAVKQGKIVGIYTFATHGDAKTGAESYIVMEYVGGRTLKAIRRDHGPLPPAEAVSYILGILPAFAYLHGQGLVYCDFKPDNVMLEGDDVKLIDMGAVRRIGDPGGDVYGTVGYQAPEAGDDPIAASDLYTIGRTLAVLLMDFDNTNHYAHALPPPNALLYSVPVAALEAAGSTAQAALRAALPGGAPLPGWLSFEPGRRVFSGTAPTGVTGVDVVVTATLPGAAPVQMPLRLGLPLTDNESLYRFLQKATAEQPDARFADAEEMGAQLLGVLRETVSRTAPLPSADSAVFLRERNPPDVAPAGLEGAWRRLPDLRLDSGDPAAAEVFAATATADPVARAQALAAASRFRADSAELRLRQADALIEANVTDPAIVMRLLDAAAGVDPGDWRPDWYCGKLYLSQGRSDEAVECFDRVYSEIPGEPVPKLALALALETGERLPEAAGLYDTASLADPGLTAAAFGLARCRMTAGDLDGAVEALARVPDGAIVRSDAQLAAVQALCALPGGAGLARASALLTAMQRDDIARHQAEARLAEEAVRQIGTGALQAANGATLLGVPIRPATLRRRAEAALRACARLAPDWAERVAFVDQANAVRPRTWL